MESRDPLENMLFRQNQVENDLKGGIADHIRENFPQVDKREDLSVDEFYEQYVTQNKPVVLGKLCEGIEKYNLDYFEENAGDEKVIIDMYDASAIHEGTVAELVKRIKSSTIDAPVYLQEWWFQEVLPEIIDDVMPIPHFSDNWIEKVLGFNIYTLWVGAAGALTPVHEDTTTFNLLSMQMFGRKEWMFFSNESYLYPDSQGKPDYDRLFADEKTQPMSVVLEAGDILYMPAKWWHRTETLEHSASINTAYITENIIQPYMRSLFTIPLLLALRSQELEAANPVRYNVTKERIQKMANLFKFDPDYIFKNSMNKADEDLDKAA